MCEAIFQAIRRTCHALRYSLSTRVYSSAQKKNTNRSRFCGYILFGRKTCTRSRKQCPRTAAAIEQRLELNCVGFLLTEQSTWWRARRAVHGSKGIVSRAQRTPYRQPFVLCVVGVTAGRTCRERCASVRCNASSYWLLKDTQFPQRSFVRRGCLPGHEGGTAHVSHRETVQYANKQTHS